ncbi:MAG: glycosyltransferase [Candidatus Levybacteria bacterium]|nr:glycosyltransferase [Candidatus Levybacteria bacterium]
MRISFITTVLNEEKYIASFLSSLFAQVKMPSEIIIVDGGSSDRTVPSIKHQISKIKNNKKYENIGFKLIVKKGNRSVGRNEAIKNATGDIVVCSDAGNILDRYWIKNIIKPLENPKIDVVSGYYKGKPKTVFQRCLVPYILVMEDKVNPNTFLPSTRSVAFRKNIWEKTGGFSKKYSHNEDYVFAKSLQKIGAKIVFAKDAFVYWIPRKNIKETFTMFFRFALGDGESGILRRKVIFIFARYILGFYLLLLSFIEKSWIPVFGFSLGLLFYIGWAIKKNYKYVKKIGALFFLPLLQFVSDLAVLSGTLFGVGRNIKFSFILGILNNNRWITAIIGIYVLIMLILLGKGIPNLNHPFNYFMDEWHQAQAVRTVFAQGSPNVPGSANGSMFHFLLSGVWLVPFYLLGFINPFAIQSPIESFEMQHKLFQVLRLNTLFFGVMSSILIAYIAKKYLNIHPFFSTFLFIINPSWLSFSNYFKYDIALIFWILLSIVFFFDYVQSPTFRSFYVASFLSGVAFAVKVSAFPLILVLLFAFLLNREKKRFSEFLIGMAIFIGTFFLLGIPDLILGRGNIYEYLFDNLIRTPSSTNYIVGMPYVIYILSIIPSTVFGYVLFFTSFLGIIFLLFDLSKNRNFYNKTYRLKLFIFISFIIFFVSLIPLKIEARGNRLLVLLPFLVLISGLFINQIYNILSRSKRMIFLITVILLGTLQAVESLSWVYLKLQPDPRQLSSEWIIKNIPLKSSIGIENIPIYQFLPDVILSEFYKKKYNPDLSTKFQYVVTDSSTPKLPKHIIITNEEISKYLKESSKKSLLKRIREKKYDKIFSANLNLSILKIFRSERDYYMSGMPQLPISISYYRL